MSAVSCVRAKGDTYILVTPALFNSWTAIITCSRPRAVSGHFFLLVESITLAALCSASPCRITKYRLPESATFSRKLETDPTTSTFVHSAHFHTGNGAPQKRWRDTAQSRAPSSHLPKR